MSKNYSSCWSVVLQVRFSHLRLLSMQISDENKTLVLYWYNEQAVKDTQTISNNFVRLPFKFISLARTTRTRADLKRTRFTRLVFRKKKEKIKHIDFVFSDNRQRCSEVSKGPFSISRVLIKSYSFILPLFQLEINNLSVLFGNNQ